MPSTGLADQEDLLGPAAVDPAGVDLDRERGVLEPEAVQIGVFDVVGDEPGVVQDAERAEVGDQAVDPGLGREGVERGVDPPGVSAPFELQLLSPLRRS